MFDESLLLLAQNVQEMALNSGTTVASAESCTGGMVATLLTANAGSSAWVAGGFVTYNNAMKEKQLGVAREILEEHGAVSEPTVRAMAEGAAKRAGVTTAVSTTGVAGPSGGTLETPVGLVWIGLHHKGRTYTWQHHFNGDRTQIRVQATEAALNYLYAILEEDAERAARA